MDVIFWEWAGALVRWLHIVAGIAWIGSSFYFIHLDLSLKPRRGLPPGAKGDAWQVHGGGFYHLVKYMVAPAKMPDHLTWFKWEAYTTWLSGMALLAIVYYLGAELYLVDKAVFDISPMRAITTSVLGLAGAWILYEIVCRSPLGKSEAGLSLFLYLLLVALSYAFAQTLSGRGMFVQIGALIGTIMVANVFVVIMPNQRKTVARLIAKKKPDAAWGEQAKQRSVHNNYLTLPVIFLMMGTHYPLFYATKYNWLIVAIVLAIGPLMRVFFNFRHANEGADWKKSPWWTWAVVALGVILIGWLSSLGLRDSQRSETPTSAPNFAVVENIVISRCSVCHAVQPVWLGIAKAPHNVLLDTPENIRKFAHLIETYSVRSIAMPPGNITGMTPEERAALAAWLTAKPRPE
ncbi:MAG: urate hydroxylase PuuD [Rhizobiales bacterium]|nr:urate hydroxylase PuuD [Hyphomicrobiales bacterium]